MGKLQASAIGKGWSGLCSCFIPVDRVSAILAAIQSKKAAPSKSLISRVILKLRMRRILLS